MTKARKINNSITKVRKAKGRTTRSDWFVSNSFLWKLLTLYIVTGGNSILHTYIYRKGAGIFSISFYIFDIFLRNIFDYQTMNWKLCELIFGQYCQ